MRADVNLSVREVGSETFGTRTETKNLNSFSAIARAIEAEKNRQIDLIESGERVVVGHACGEPSYLLDVLVSKADQYENVELVHMIAMGKAGYAQPGMEKHFRHNSFFVGTTTRKAVAEGRADFTPCFFYRILI